VFEGNLLPVIREEIEYCIQTELPHHKGLCSRIRLNSSCSTIAYGQDNSIAEWTPLSIQEVAPRLIAIVMGRVLVGPGLNREEEWVNCVTQFVSNVYMGGVKLKGFSHFTRPFTARFLIPEIRRVWRH
jgi:hypothetical protein